MKIKNIKYFLTPRLENKKSMTSRFSRSTLSINFIKQKPKIWPAYNLAIFRVSAILFMILFVADYFIPGVVTNWGNPIYILLVALLSGMLAVSQDSI